MGPDYWRLKYKYEKLDVFNVSPPAQWGSIFLIRTGDADFSHWIVQQGYKRGIHQLQGHLEQIGDEHGPLMQPLGGVVPSNARRTIIPTPEEKDYFTVMGLPYIEPRERNLETIKRLRELNAV